MKGVTITQHWRWPSGSLATWIGVRIAAGLVDASHFATDRACACCRLLERRYPMRFYPVLIELVAEPRPGWCFDHAAGVQLDVLEQTEALELLRHPVFEVVAVRGRENDVQVRGVQQRITGSADLAVHAETFGERTELLQSGNADFERGATH